MKTSQIITNALSGIRYDVLTGQYVKIPESKTANNKKKSPYWTAMGQPVKQNPPPDTNKKVY